ncbi:ABC transporter substrate-binding protein [Frankia sp. CNm7]|uniref:ABC transporter substrate-binding protein n=1 Tax=Frankia nepalensis TaxID=1836974 RepID=A0A937RN29_9ACTN|nr:ABC transporter substrate-binding protein [Frankia nepalensis]MBL7495976.1 ABC transporter substrate-binding protein [Frankia nepalensis]MBL7513329.1 ABC transporter substrate-binding protein [Frankia nepalensis]MBL7517612.1 ABC transporter substrate-binding protein [Frankia nepalensis]MBL7633477.1 ABC transporter substrate-binding protein [Frankia nepalensis]
MTVLNVALVTPLTGPDAAQGLASLRGLTLWARDESLPLPWTDISVTAYDAHPDPAAAMRTAVAAKPAAILGPYGRRAAIAAFSATDRVVFNTGAPTTRFMRQTYPKVINMAAPSSTWPRQVLALVRTADRTARRAVVLLSAGDFAIETTASIKAAARSTGFEVTTSTFGPGQAAIAASRLPSADVLIVHADPDDELAAASALLRRPWRAAAFSTAVSAQVAASFGDASDGLLAPGSWQPDSMAETTTGPNAWAFTDDFRALHGTAPTATAAWTYVSGLILGACIRRSGGVDDASVLAAARGLDTVTLLGRFRLDETTGLQVGHQIPIVQWQSNASWTVWPRERARAQFAHPRWQARTATPGLTPRPYR